MTDKELAAADRVRRKQLDGTEPEGMEKSLLMRLVSQSSNRLTFGWLSLGNMTDVYTKKKDVLPFMRDLRIRGLVTPNHRAANEFMAAIGDENPYSIEWRASSEAISRYGRKDMR